MRIQNLKRYVFFMAAVFALSGDAISQQSSVDGWVFLSHEQMLSKKWSALSDIQVRSSNKFAHIETILLRPAIQFKWTKAQSLAVGYAYLGARVQEQNEKIYQIEHRLWQQYQLETENNKTVWTNRVRLEQRFIQGERRFDFSQRARFYSRIQLFLQRQMKAKRQMYFAFQNEVFLNVQHPEHVNGKLLGENRAHGAVGYHFSKNLEVEGGYMYRFEVEDVNVHHHVFQISLRTKLSQE